MDSSRVPPKINRHVQKAVTHFTLKHNGSTFSEILEYVKNCNRNLRPVSNLKEIVQAALNNFMKMGVIQRDRNSKYRIAESSLHLGSNMKKAAQRASANNSGNSTSKSINRRRKLQLDINEGETSPKRRRIDASSKKSQSRRRTVRYNPYNKKRLAKAAMHHYANAMFDDDLDASTDSSSIRTDLSADSLQDIYKRITFSSSEANKERPTCSKVIEEIYPEPGIDCEDSEDHLNKKCNNDTDDENAPKEEGKQDNTKNAENSILKKAENSDNE